MFFCFFFLGGGGGGEGGGLLCSRSNSCQYMTENVNTMCAKMNYLYISLNITEVLSKAWNVVSEQIDSLSWPGAGIMEADDRQVTTVFTVQQSVHHRHSTNRVS